MIWDRVPHESESSQTQNPSHAKISISLQNYSFGGGIHRLAFHDPVYILFGRLVYIPLITPENHHIL